MSDTCVPKDTEDTEDKKVVVLSSPPNAPIAMKECKVCQQPARMILDGRFACKPCEAIFH